MAAVHTPYNPVGLQINGGRIHTPSERYLPDFESHYIPSVQQFSGGCFEYQRQPGVPNKGTLFCT